MSASFDETARALLRATDANGGLDTRGLFDLMVAAHEEQASQAEYQRKALNRIASHLESEAGRVEEAATKALRAHVANAHPVRAPRRASDPEDMDWRSVVGEAAVTSKRVWVMWGCAVFVAVALGNALIMFVIERVMNP